MPSEHRLHPASLLFALAGSIKTLALPALVVGLTSLRPSPAGGVGGGRQRGGPGAWVNPWLPGDVELSNWQVWLLFFSLLATVSAVVRYLTFRVRYEGGELVIRSGLFVRNERHVPYHRIQNLDATRNVLHRLLGVADVRIETGGGAEPEARISVIDERAFAEMRRRVFEGRGPAATADQGTADAADTASVPEAAHTLLHLPLRELLLLGLLDNRGLFLVGAAYGVLWETGLQGVLWERLTGGRYAAGLLSDAWRRLADGQVPPLWQMGVAAAGLAGLIVLVRLLSMAWVSVALYDFRLERVGRDLRTEYGLLTRVTTTIPVARIQGLTVRDTPLQRLLGRASVRVDTAGGRGAAGAPGGSPSRPRERLAPIIRAAAVPALVRHVMPHGDPDMFDWQPLHSRAFRRAVVPILLVTAVPSIVVVAFIDIRWWPVMLAGMALAALITHQQVRHMAWAVHDDAVAVRQGWLWRTLTVTPVARIQAVSSTESPFDRRSGMAGVRVDNAAGGGTAQGMNIPYLARETARALAARLSAGAAQTTFRW